MTIIDLILKHASQLSDEDKEVVHCVIKKAVEDELYEQAKASIVRQLKTAKKLSVVKSQLKLRKFYQDLTLINPNAFDDCIQQLKSENRIRINGISAIALPQPENEK